MNKEILTKMGRFVELSAKFSKEENEIFPKTQTNNITNINTSWDNNFKSNSNLISNSDILNIKGRMVLNEREIYTDGYGHVKSREIEEPTRADEIRERARELAILSDEFDEYNKLRSDLSNYFEAVKKLVD